VPEHHNPKREAFLQQYLLDFDGAKAAARAGYKSKSHANLRRMANEILADPESQARLAELIAARNKRVGIAQEDVLAEIAFIAFARPQPRFFRIEQGLPVISAHDATEEDLCHLSEVQNTITSVTTHDDGTEETVRSVKVKFHDKLAALEKLAKHTGVYAESEDRLGGKNRPVASLIEAINGRGSTLPLATENGDA